MMMIFILTDMIPSIDYWPQGINWFSFPYWNLSLVKSRTRKLSNKIYGMADPVVFGYLILKPIFLDNSFASLSPFLKFWGVVEELVPLSESILELIAVLAVLERSNSAAPIRECSSRKAASCF
jgi:hypothetical protein